MLTHLFTLTLAATSTALLAFGPANLHELDPGAPRGNADAGRSKAPCDGVEGWVGDGEDGRAAPACDGPDGDETDPAGLREPDWALRGDDSEGDDASPWP